MQSHWVYLPHLKESPYPAVDSQCQTISMVSLETLFLILLWAHFLCLIGLCLYVFQPYDFRGLCILVCMCIFPMFCLFLFFLLPVLWWPSSPCKSSLLDMVLNMEAIYFKPIIQTCCLFYIFPTYYLLLIGQYLLSSNLTFSSVWDRLCALFKPDCVLQAFTTVQLQECGKLPLPQV